MGKVIEIPGVGNVEFPDDMADEAIASAIQAMPGAKGPPVHKAAPGVSNVPASYLTGDPETDAKIADNLANNPHGNDKPITRESVARASAILASLGAPELLGPIAGGAAAGALFGGGTSEAPDAPGMARDALVQGALGAAGGYLIPKAINAAAPLVSRAGGWLRNAAVNQGRKALSGIGTALSARAPIPAPAVVQALESGAIRPFAGVEGIAKRLGAQADVQGERYAQILSELEQRGVHGPNAEALAQQLVKESQAAAATSLNSSRPGQLLSTAQELATKPLPPTGNGRLGLMQSEQMKRGLQQEAQREYDKISRQFTTTGETKKEIAGLMKTAIEDAVSQQAALAPDAAAAFQPVKAELANTLGGLRAAEEGAARAARRKPVSLSSTIVGGALAGGGHEALALPAAMAHGFIDHRLPATLASSAYAGSELANALAKYLPKAASEQSGQMGQAALAQALQRRFGLVPAAADDPAAGP